MNASAIVLAAGLGTRMKSDLPKVLHPILEKPLVAWVIESSLAAGIDHIVLVVGYRAAAVEEEVRQRFPDANIDFVLQQEQLGTGHAVQCALSSGVSFQERIVILYGDCPEIPSEVIHSLLRESEGDMASLVTASIDNPTGYGRIIRDKTGTVSCIREHRDCSKKELEITEVNPGIYAFDRSFLEKEIDSLSSNNASGELYLTDLIERAYLQNQLGSTAGTMDSLKGINTLVHLADAQRRLSRLRNEKLAESGVHFSDLDRAFVSTKTEIESGAFVERDVVLRGACRVSASARIGDGCVLKDCDIAEGATLLPYVVAFESSVGPHSSVGPFAHLRSGTRLGAATKVGNFVETKNTVMEDETKAGHLSYLGDGVIEKGANIGAGTIFCNYDGAQKHQTTIGKGAFIGSDSQLVAPIKVGQGAYVASGTTVVRDVPNNALALSRVKQENKEGYAELIRRKNSADKIKS